jgi:hypothetical protein
MSADYSFDYEFVICNCGFPTGDPECPTGNCLPFSTTYALCTLPDTSGTRYQLIYNKVEELLNLVAQIKHLKIFSSFITIDNYRYKVTIGNESFTEF